MTSGGDVCPTSRHGAGGNEVKDLSSGAKGYQIACDTCNWAVGRGTPGTWSSQTCLAGKVTFPGRLYYSLAGFWERMEPVVILGGRAQLGICVIRCWDWAESGWIVQDTQFLLFLSQVADFVVLPKPRCLFCCSVAQSCLTLCDPMGYSIPSFPLSLLSPGVCSNSCPLSWWCHPTISSSITPFSSYLQSLPASGSFSMSRLFASGGQSIGASASFLPVNIQGWFPLGLTGWISLQSKGLSRVFSNTTVWKHQFFGAQPLWSNSHIHPWLLEIPERKQFDINIFGKLCKAAWSLQVRGLKMMLSILGELVWEGESQVKDSNFWSSGWNQNTFSHRTLPLPSCPHWTRSQRLCQLFCSGWGEVTHPGCFLLPRRSLGDLHRAPRSGEEVSGKEQQHPAVTAFMLLLNVL